MRCCSNASQTTCTARSLSCAAASSATRWLHSSSLPWSASDAVWNADEKLVDSLARLWQWSCLALYVSICTRKPSKLNACRIYIYKHTHAPASLYICICICIYTNTHTHACASKPALRTHTHTHLLRRQLPLDAFDLCGADQQFLACVVVVLQQLLPARQEPVNTIAGLQLLVHEALSY